VTAIVIAILFALALLLTALFRKHAEPERAEGLEGAWAAALEREDSQVARMLLSVSKPFGQLPQVHLHPESAMYKMLRLKLASAGGMFGGSVEVFLSVQIMAALLAAGALGATVAFQVDGLLLGSAVVFALAFAAMPYNRVSTAAKKRQESVIANLPEFAELLLMPVTSGYGILPALDFTASRLEGPVASEVRLMLQILASRAAPEQQAFLDTGERLGTPASITFFNTLYQSHVDGVKIADNIRGQAEQLRKQSYERTRALLKKLPNTLVIIMGVHLLPFLFTVVLLPTFMALGSM
jgi:tight adherence protein C